MFALKLTENEPAGQCHGLITAAARHLVAYAIEERGIHRVEWRNRKEEVWSMLASEWRALTTSVS